MENEPIKSALEEIAEKFRIYVDGMIKDGAYFPRHWPYTDATIQKVNNECIALVRRYIEMGELEIGASGDCIWVYNAPLDILPLIPMACPEISDRGTYDVMCGLKRLGRVAYGGPPEPGEPGTIIVGAKTNFMPEERMAHISFTIEGCDFNAAAELHDQG